MPDSSLSFTQGFLLGQLTIALIIFAFIKFFIFGEAPPSPSSSRPLLSNHPSLSKKRSNAVLRAPQPNALSTDTILAKTYYNVHGHQPESLDWFNVLIAQTIAQLRADALHEGAIVKSLHSILNGKTRPEWIQEIKITEVALGEEFPIFSNCRIIPVDGDGRLGVPGVAGEGRLQARMDVDLSDLVTLGVETRLVLNWPRKVVAVLPVALAVSVVRFSGTLSMTFIPSSTPNLTSLATSGPSFQSDAGNTSSAQGDSPDHRASPTTLAFTFLPDYTLELSIRSLLGSRSRLQDVPKIAQLIEARVHQWFNDRCVEPRFQQIVLPSLWPRKKTTRGGEDESLEEGLGSTHDAVHSSSHKDRRKGVLNNGESESRTEPATDQYLQLERKMRDEGAKLRDAEKKANERAREPRSKLESTNLRRRVAGNESERNDDFTMPGSMPGGMPA